MREHDALPFEKSALLLRAAKGKAGCETTVGKDHSVTWNLALIRVAVKGETNESRTSRRADATSYLSVSCHGTFWYATNRSVDPFGKAFLVCRHTLIVREQLDLLRHFPLSDTSLAIRNNRPRRSAENARIMSMTRSHLKPHYDAVIIGAGAAGLSCALGLVREWEKNQESNHNPGEMPSVLVLSKVQPLRSHTGSAEGGIAASLGNIEPDNWQWHYRDTIKGGDWLVDQDAAKILTQEAPRTVIQLEHDGVAFSRTEDGHIAQRKFGGHTANGEKPVRRVAYAADRIGHQILHTLWQQCQRYDTIHFADEWYVTDLVVEGLDADNPDGGSPRVCGIVAMEEASGTLQAVEAPSVVLATGGAGRVYHTTSNSWDLTGDGMALALTAGLQLEDIEFMQFHPTGLAHTGILLSEAARGEGGVLRNSDLEPFMQRYAPGVGDLAARDVVARAIQQEVAEGRGVADPLTPDSPHDCVWLDLRSIGEERLEEALPEVCSTVREFAGLDPAKDLIPIKPTAHYTMGGIPVSLDGSVYCITKDKSEPMPVQGLKAAGECSCVSVHGANRLGANSLLDAVVFGTRSGRSIAETRRLHHPSQNHNTSTKTLATALAARTASIDALLSQAKGSAISTPTDTTSADIAHTNDSTTASDNPYKLMTDLGIMMESHIGVSCDAASINAAIDQLENTFIPRAQRLTLHDASHTFNQELCAIMEARNLVRVALAMAVATLNRQESRGSLYRRDYPDRDDERFLSHSFTTMSGTVLHKPVVIDDYPPQKRTY